VEAEVAENEGLHRSGAASKETVLNIAKWKDVWRRFSGSGAYPHELAFVLLLPLRRFLLSPETLIRHLHLTHTSRVLELGPGPGFFSIPVARAIPNGRLELVDIQIEMLRKARRRIRRAGAHNIGYTRATGVALPFLGSTFDVAFLVTVLGEVPDPRACVLSIAQVLRPGGWLVVAELAGDPDALTEQQLRDFTVSSGLQFVEVSHLSRGLIAIFRRQSNDDLLGAQRHERIDARGAAGRQI
jgi:uncharacterized protein